MKVAIAAYGAGNVRSVEIALRELGAETELAQQGSALLDADLAVLAGVGSAASAMAGLRTRGLDRALHERMTAGRSILGICLGLQLALEETEEDGGVTGLGLVAGRAVRLREGRTPRIGWAPVEPSDETYWFAHSFAAETASATGTSEGIVAVVESGAFLGVQFHPEKSGRAGRRFLATQLARCLSPA